MPTRSFPAVTTLIAALAVTLMFINAAAADDFPGRCTTNVTAEDAPECLKLGGQEETRQNCRFWFRVENDCDAAMTLHELDCDTCEAIVQVEPGQSMSVYLDDPRPSANTSHNFVWSHEADSGIVDVELVWLASWPDEGCAGCSIQPTADDAAWFGLAAALLFGGLLASRRRRGCHDRLDD